MRKVLKLLNKLSSCAPTIATKSYAALVQNHNLVGKRHGLHLVMGHIDHDGFQILVQLGKFEPHLHAQQRIKIRQAGDSVGHWSKSPIHLDKKINLGFRQIS